MIHRNKPVLPGILAFLLSVAFLPSVFAEIEPLAKRWGKPLQPSAPPADLDGRNDSNPAKRLPLDSTVPDSPFSPPDAPAAVDPLRTSEIQLRPVAIINKAEKGRSQGYLYRIDEAGNIDVRPTLLENPLAVMGSPDEDALIGSIQDPGFTANQELKLYLVKSSTTVAELNSVDIPGNRFAEVFVSGNSVKFYALADDFDPAGPGAAQKFSLFTPLSVPSASDGLQAPSD